jgi:serine/threonine protein phosphatase PrpC
MVLGLAAADAQAGGKGERAVRPNVRRLHLQSLRLELPIGARRQGLQILEDAARRHGVGLRVVRLKAGPMVSRYGVIYASPSRKRLAAFEVSALLRQPEPLATAAATASPTGRSIRLGVITDKNLRGENQDVFEQAENARGDLLLLVFDGAGGHAGGRQAAEKGARDVRRHFATSGDDALQGVRDSFTFANQENLRAKGAGATIGASTAVGVVITKEGRLISANLGDSRAYRLSARSGRVYRLTRDHNGPQENIITQHLGKRDGFDPEVKDHGPIRSGDRLLISSDGLHKFVSDAVIRRELKRQGVSLDRIAANLTAIAKRNGSDDNITIHLYEHP